MKRHVKIKEVKTIDEIPGYWTDSEIIKLLEEFEYLDAGQSNPSELRDLLALAMSDFEPEESAEKVLKYKLGNVLTDGQIQNISHEMVEDKISEEYPDIALHYALFNINQILYQSYNGKFPQIKATYIKLDLSSDQSKNTKEVVLKAICEGLSETSPIKRLYVEELAGSKTFTEAESIIWEMKTGNGDEIEIITSDYWVAKSDIVEGDYDCEVKVFEE